MRPRQFATVHAIVTICAAKEPRGRRPYAPFPSVRRKSVAIERWLLLKLRISPGLSLVTEK